MIKKIALYTSFLVASFADAAVFLISNNYIQLVLAILLYFPLIYIAFKIFPRRTSFVEQIPIQKGNIIGSSIPIDNKMEQYPTTQPPSTDDVEISDINKRVILKILGVTGLSFFISSLISKKFSSRVFGQSEEPSLTSIIDSAGNIIDPAKNRPIDNYRISEIDDYDIDSYYGFIDENDNWFIMKEDMDAGTYRYIKGDSNFPDNWNNRKNLTYDYYNKIFTKP